ncbi:ESX secretion-associated protein EspG [Nocardia sp. NPDC051832]|uniref:ESX secretion-associated protein EspG n=1 Tax=Nocardia sp. NPDC051832 TaxID=3155673 RepID=UPI00341CAA86
MSKREWTFTPLAFKVLWRAADRDVLPYPLQYRSTADTIADYDKAWKAEAAALHKHFDETMFGALRILAEPEARIEVAGKLGRDKLRVHAAVHYQHAVLLVQEPTDAPDRGGRVRMTMVPAHEISRRVLGQLPNTARGTGEGIEVSRHDLDEDGPFRGFHDDAPVSPRKLAARFFERPRGAVVHVAVYAGPAWDNRPAPSRGFHIMDYPDGRYVVRNGGTLKASPADRSLLAADLDRILAITVESHRAESDPAYRSRV